MHAKNLQMIAELKKQGIDTTELEKILNATPAIDNYIGQGITRTPEFTNIINEKRQVEAQLQDVRSQLAAMQNQIKGGNLNTATITAIDTRMKALKQFLIDEDYPESQVNPLFKDIEENIAASLNPNPTPPVSNHQSQTQHPAFSQQDREGLRNEAAAVGAALSTRMNMRLQRANAEFFSLYKRYPNEQELDSLDNAINLRHIQGGENLDSVISETFKFSEQRQANANAEMEAKIAEAKNAGRAEAFQEMGQIPGGAPQGGRISRAPISSHFAGSKSPVINNGNIPVNNQPQQPQNPNDKAMPFQQRGNKAQRMQHLAEVVSTKPEIFQADSYTPSYGQQQS